MEIIRTGAPRLGTEERLVLPSGDIRWILMDKIPYRDDTDAIIGIIVMILDITKRKQMEESLRQRSADLRTMVSAMANRELRMIELKEEIARLRKQSPEGTV
jgi:PAS domain-containing protein